MLNKTELFSQYDVNPEALEPATGIDAQLVGQPATNAPVYTQPQSAERRQRRRARQLSSPSRPSTGWRVTLW